MSLEKLRTELHETIRQSRDMSKAINEALTTLLDETQDLTQVRKKVSVDIIIGLQAQDRLEQRCRSIEAILDRVIESESAAEERLDNLWNKTCMDELSKPELSCKGTAESGEVELF